MKTKDIFKLAVRLLGLVFLYQGLVALPAVFAVIVTGAFSFVGFIMDVIMVAWPLAVAYWLVCGAPLLMRMAYPETETSSDGEQ